jgi:hypothetical protein
MADELCTVQGVGTGCYGGRVHVMFGTSWVKAQGYEACKLIIMKTVFCTV